MPFPILNPYFHFDDFEEQKQLVNFDQAAKFTVEKELDVAATLGEMIKQAFNQAVAEPQQIKGNLCVTWKHVEWFEDLAIQSDQPDERLEKLIAWLNREVDKSHVGQTIHNIRTIHLVDWYFIYPHLEDFRKYLAGEHPLKFIMGGSNIFKFYEEYRFILLEKDNLEASYVAKEIYGENEFANRVDVGNRLELSRCGLEGCYKASDKQEHLFELFNWLELKYKDAGRHLQNIKSLTQDFKSTIVLYIIDQVLARLRFHDLDQGQLHGISLMTCLYFDKLARAAFSNKAAAIIMEYYVGKGVLSESHYTLHATDKGRNKVEAHTEKSVLKYQGKTI